MLSHSACATMFSKIAAGSAAAGVVLSRVIPHLVANAADAGNYEVRRTAIVVFKQVFD